MAKGFIFIIYLAFISLGLPDAILGAAWPTMRQELNMQLGAAGIISMVIAGGTIVSSVISGKLIAKLGTGKITLISCIMTASALLGFSLAGKFALLVLLAIPLGLGAGAVDSALNHYVAENYKAHHMNWLHAFWGIGATAGPLIMAYFISFHSSWRRGYLGVAFIQFLLVCVLIASLSMWKKVAVTHKREESHSHHFNTSPAKNALKIKGVKYALLTFLFYCGAESTIGLWGASYLVASKNMLAEAAAVWVALYFGGITVGRIVTGFIAVKVDNRHLIFYGEILSIIGSLMLLLPFPMLVSKIGLIVIGLGLAPIFPGLLHETPKRFGKANSAKLIGYQMAMAYTGTTFLPAIFGLIATRVSINIFPVTICSFLFIMFMSSERVNAAVKKTACEKDDLLNGDEIRLEN